MWNIALTLVRKPPHNRRLSPTWNTDEKVGICRNRAQLGLVRLLLFYYLKNRKICRNNVSDRTFFCVSQEKLFETFCAPINIYRITFDRRTEMRASSIVYFCSFQPKFKNVSTYFNKTQSMKFHTNTFSGSRVVTFRHRNRETVLS